MDQPAIAQDRLYQEFVLLHDRICRAISDPKRLMIMYALQQGPRYVVELAEELNYPQPTVSRHLNALYAGGLVVKERRGQAVYYSLRDERIIAALDLLRSMLRDMTEETARVASMLAVPGSGCEDAGEAGR